MGDIDIYPSQTSSAPLSGSTLAYAQVTANQGSITTETDLTGLSVTVTVPAGRRLRVSIGTMVSHSLADGLSVLRLHADGVLVQSRTLTQQAGVGTDQSTSLDAVLSPAEGTHTYKARLWAVNGTATLVAAATNPAFILVEDITGNQNIAPVYSVPVGVLVQAVRVTDFGTTSTSSVSVPDFSLNVVVPAGRLLKLNLQCFTYASVTGDDILIRFLEDGVEKHVYVSPDQETVHGRESFITHLISPSAGSHTYSIDIRRSGGSGTVYLGGRSEQPAQFWIEDVTPTPASGQGAPGSTLGYAEVVADQTGITTITDLTGLAVTVTVPAGRRLRITGYIPQFSRTAGTVTYADIRINEGAVQLTQYTAAMANTYSGAQAIVVVTPSAGTHTYKLRGSSDGTVTLEAGVGIPAFILVEDITAAEWPVISAVTTGAILQQAAEPSSPILNDIWLDTDESSGVGLSSILAYAEVTAQQLSITAEVDLTGLSVNVTVPAGRRLRITGNVYMQNSTAGIMAALALHQDGAQVQSSQLVMAGVNIAERMHIESVLSPSAGTHTYKLRGYAAGGSGSLIAGAAYPAFILVEDITGTLWPAGQSIGAGTIANEAWTNWVPSWAGLTVGNGTLLAKYMKVGRTIDLRIRFILGSTSAVGTDPRFLLPIAAASDYVVEWPIGQAVMIDTGVKAYNGFVELNSLTEGLLRNDDGANSFSPVTSTAPFTWGTTDHFMITARYEGAS